MAKDSRLLDAETDVMLDLNAAIVKIQAEKWNRVQKVMEEKGSKEKYPAAFLEKMWKELMANPGEYPPRLGCYLQLNAYPRTKSEEC